MSDRCAVKGCGSAPHARGWCLKHYARWQRHGDPTVTLRPGGLCAVADCEREIKARGFCKNHYVRFMRYGDPLGGPGKGSQRQDPQARFWKKVEKTKGCWIWRGPLSNLGYGQFWLDGRTVRAHRFAYEQEHGPIPGRLQLDHLCKNRACVRPSHLEAVTAKVNNARSNSPSARNTRKTHCPRGHSYAEEGVIYRGRRYCAACVPAMKRWLD